MLKVTAHADDVRTVGEALAVSAASGSGAAYREFGARTGHRGGHEREVALYRDADPVLRAHTPDVIATHAIRNARAWAVLLEDLAAPRCSIR